MNPTDSQIQSIVTSSLSVPIANCEKYLETIDLELGLDWPSLKSFLVLGPQSLFRIITLSTFMVFFEGGSILIIFVYWIVPYSPVLALCCSKSGDGGWKQRTEAVTERGRGTRPRHGDGTFSFS